MTISLVLVKTNDFSEIYEAIESTKRKIPARVLRYCKEQLYELVQSAEPEKKLCVVDIDEIDTKEDVEFLVGVGVISKEPNGPASVGYAPISLEQLIDDLLNENGGYDSQQIVDNVLPHAIKKTPNVPIFKYLRSIGINSQESYSESALNLDKVVGRDFKDFRVKSYSKPFFRTYRHMSIKEIIEACTPENSSAYIPFYRKKKLT